MVSGAEKKKMIDIKEEKRWAVYLDSGSPHQRDKAPVDVQLGHQIRYVLRGALVGSLVTVTREKVSLEINPEAVK